MLKPDGQAALKDLGMTSAAIQQRVNQLTRELHSLERHDNAIRAIEGLQSKNDKGSNKTGKGKTVSKKASKKGNQTAIHSFFVKAAGGKKSASVVELSDTEESVKQDGADAANDSVHVVEMDMSPAPREGEDQSGTEESESKTFAGEKRGSPGSSELPSPEKKLRSA